MSKTFHLVLPTVRLLRGASRQKERVYANTSIDFTGLIELCLQHWDEIAALVGENDLMVKNTYYDELLHPFCNDRKLPYKKMLLVSHALRDCLEACYDSILPWLDIAKTHFEIDHIVSLRAKAYISQSGLIMEIVT